MIVDALVEGIPDEAVAVRLIRHSGHSLGEIYGKRGWRYIHDKISGFNIRARYGSPILVLVDFMDTRLECPPELPRNWLPDQLREAIVPPPRVSSVVGPAYNSALEEFVLRHWSVDSSILRAPSLEKCVQRLRELTPDAEDQRSDF